MVERSAKPRKRVRAWYSPPPAGGQSMHTFILAFFAAVLLCGCASPLSRSGTRGGDGPPALSGELEIDTFVCERWSPAGGGRINAEGFRTCMIALGWEPVDDGASTSSKLAQQ